MNRKRKQLICSCIGIFCVCEHVSVYKSTSFRIYKEFFVSYSFRIWSVCVLLLFLTHNKCIRMRERETGTHKMSSVVAGGLRKMPKSRERDCNFGRSTFCVFSTLKHENVFTPFIVYSFLLLNTYTHRRRADVSLRPMWKL